MSAASPFWPYPELVVHRAGGYLAPENTLAALRKAASVGAKAAEIDVQLTSDGRLFLCHDEHLGRVVQARGCVAEMTAKELEVLTVVNSRCPLQSPESVCFLEEAAALCGRLGMMINVELKAQPERERLLAEAAAEVLGGLRLGVPVLISSFSSECLGRYRELRPEDACGFLFEDADAPWERIARELKLQSVHPCKDILSRALTEKAHEACLGVMVWTVDDPAEALALRAAGADAVCTNCPQELLSELTGQSCVSSGEAGPRT